MNDNRKALGIVLGLLAAAGCIIAGIYLLDSQSAATETTVFDSMMHGAGVYFIARGIWMLREMAR